MPFVDHKDLPKEQRCMDPGHNPPSHIVLRDGIHTWRCPGCGKETQIVVQTLRC